jgi:predicted ATPase
MNYRGSYRKLLDNASAAMMASIEIYNKPMFKYRDECVVILLLNAWELLLKAILSNSGESVFYRKKRKEPYRTLSWRDACLRAEKYFTTSVSPLPVRRNLELLGTYRDNSVHFYNAKDFGVLLYALAQTCIKNFRDLLDAKFRIKLEDEINWQLLPLGIKPPVDVVSYISGSTAKKASGAVRQYLAELARAADEVKTANEDSGRLLTVFNVKLESIKKIGDADVTVGVKKAEGEEGPLAIIRTQDPNITHPLRQMDVVEKIGVLHGSEFSPHRFQAVAWKHRLKENPQYCWRAKEGVLTRYSNDTVTFVKSLTPADLEAASTDYRAYLRSRLKKKSDAA